jgi:primosomal replication protein N
MILENKGNFNAAETECRTSLEMERRVYGEGADLTECRTMERRVYGEGADLSVAGTSPYQLGMILENKGNFNAAETECRTSLEMERRMYGEDADLPVAAAPPDQRVMILEKNGKFDRAKTEYRASLEMEWRVCGEDCDHPDVGTPRIRWILHFRERRLSSSEDGLSGKPVDGSAYP